MRYRIWAAICATTLAGCASPPPVPFASVQKRLQKQTGLRVERPPTMRGPGRVPDELLATPLTVDAAVQIALAYNRKLAAAFDALDISQAELTQAGLLKNPALELSVRLPDRAPRKTYLDFGVSDTLVDLLLVGARKRLAESSLTQSQATASHHVLQTVADVRSAYFAAQAAAQTLQLRQTIFDATQAAELAADQLRRAGNVPELKLLQTRSATLRAQGEQVEAALHVAQTRARFSALLGLLPTQTRWTLSDPLPGVPGDEPVDDWEQVALEQRQDLAAAKAEVATAAQRLGITTDTRFWGDVSAGGEGERETDGQWRIGPTLTVPIPLFDQGQGVVARAKAALQQSIDTYQALRLETVAQVRSADAEVKAARSMAQLYRDQILPTQQQLLDQTQLRFNGMYDSVFVLLEAKQTQIDYAIRYVETLRTYWTASAELDAAVGGRLPVAASQPESLPTTQPTPTKMEMDGMDMQNMDIHLQH